MTLVVVEAANTEDVEGVREVLLAAQEFQRKAAERDPDVRVWIDKNLTNEAVSVAVASGSYHVARQDGEIVGVMSVTYDGDSMYWGDVVGQSAAYIHKVSTVDGVRGQGVTQELLDHAELLGLQHGCDFARLDTHPHPKLRRNYTRWGYRRHSVRELPVTEFRPRPYRYHRFEKPLTPAAREEHVERVGGRLPAPEGRS